MTTKEAIEKIHAPKGVSSVLAGVMNGDYSVLKTESAIDTDIETAKLKIAAYQVNLDECKSDWSYWAILGDLSYWQSVVKILEAGKLLQDNLPDLSPKEAFVVMDQIGAMEDYADNLLSIAKKSQNP